MLQIFTNLEADELSLIGLGILAGYLLGVELAKLV